MSDTQEPEKITLVPAGPPIGSEPRVVPLRHECSQCGHADVIPLGIAGTLILLKPETRVAVVTPGDVLRMRDRGIV